MIQPATEVGRLVERTGGSPLRPAVRATLVYADLFEYPLRLQDVHRFLHGRGATQAEVAAELTAWPRRHGLFFLPGREALVERRLERESAAAALWQEARRYGFLLWSLPFVELVGVSGALAMNNAEASDDIDFLLVVRRGRLWTVRALTIALVRLAQLHGTRLCPNYLLTSAAFSMRQRTIFTAHELFQLVPLHGYATYCQLLAANRWACGLLPNAEPYPASIVDDRRPAHARVPRTVAEAALGGARGDAVERWEAGRKIRRFHGQAGDDAELAFSDDECKGHFDRHGRRTLSAYSSRLAAISEVT